MWCEIDFNWTGCRLVLNKFIINIDRQAKKRNQSIMNTIIILHTLPHLQHSIKFFNIDLSFGRIFIEKHEIIYIVII